MSNWERPQRMRLARRLEDVVCELRRAAPALFEAHARALEGMARVAVLRIPPNTREEAHHE